MQWGRVAADQYLSRAQDQGMATYGSDGLGVADFGLSKRYVIPPLFDYSTSDTKIPGNNVAGKAAGRRGCGPGHRHVGRGPAHGVGRGVRYDRCRRTRRRRGIEARGRAAHVPDNARL
jgi:hypothetical protein